jgi:Co/Zn/Cd efflux system component
MSAHLVMDKSRPGFEVREAAARMLADNFHILHVTLQTELRDCREGIEDHGIHA